MAHRVLAHTADTGIEVTAGSLPAAFAEMLEATFGLLADLDGAEAASTTTVEVESHTLEDLLVDVLSEFLYRSEVEDVVFCDFEVTVGAEPPRATVHAGLLPLRRDEAEGAAIKAVTYHELALEERDDGWYARVYFDV